MDPLFQASLDGTAAELQGLFSDEELKVIIKAMQGIKISPEAAGNLLQQECEALLDFSRCAVQKRLGVPEFLEKLGSLTFFQKVFLELWGGWYWDSPEIPVFWYLSSLQDTSAQKFH